MTKIASVPHDQSHDQPLLDTVVRSLPYITWDTVVPLGDHEHGGARGIEVDHDSALWRDPCCLVHTAIVILSPELHAFPAVIQDQLPVGCGWGSRQAYSAKVPV